MIFTVSHQPSVQNILLAHFSSVISPMDLWLWVLKHDFLSVITAAALKPLFKTRAECETLPHDVSFVISPLQTENSLIEMWNKTGHQGNQWFQAVVPLRNLRNFEVIFEGIRSTDVSGGAALDDLEYIDCSPSKWWTSAVCKISQTIPNIASAEIFWGDYLFCPVFQRYIM